MLEEQTNKKKEILDFVNRSYGEDLYKLFENVFGEGGEKIIKEALINFFEGASDNYISMVWDILKKEGKL